MAREYLRETVVLGSLDVFGDVLFADEYESSTLLWTGSGDGADYGVARATGAAYMGAYGLELKTRSTEPAIGDVVRATVRLPQTLDKRVTMLAHVKALSGALVKYVTFGFTGARDDYSYNLGMRYDPGGAIWGRQAPGGGWATDWGVAFDGNDNAYHRVLLVWDWSLEEYVRVVVDEKEFDVSGYAFDTTANGGDIELQAYLEVETKTAAVATSYFDNYAILEGDKVRLGGGRLSG